eukprot:TRINITY_DN11366_c0_g1_i1.p1 TRINITY_DN11366_c0_g1~~TRINITY_DN11366_c0_g1_i1.p1  ORF type:complete len:735 (+),score=256.81 TRINITY_DN11366_c0_g1_i1:116-2320(+)
MSMFGFNRSSTEAQPPEEDGESKAELLRRIQSLLEKNKRYEMRFRDTVQAYKSVLKEKEALEDTIASINTSTPATPASASKGSDDGTASDQDGGETDAAITPSTPNTPSASNEQLTSLTRAIATLNKEKKTLTERFQADKKATLEAHRDEVAKLKEEMATQQRKHAQAVAALAEEKELVQAQVNNLTQQLLSKQQEMEDADKSAQAERQKHAEELKRRMEQLSASEKDSDRVRALQKELVSAQDKELSLLAKLDRLQTEKQREMIQLNAEKEELRQQLAVQASKGESDTLLKYKTDVRRAGDQIAQLQARLKQEESTKLTVMQAAQQRIDLMQQTVTSAEKRLEEMRATHDRERMMFESRASESALLVGRYEDLRQEDLKAVDQLRKDNHELQDQLYALQAQLQSGVQQRHPDDVQQIEQLQEKVAKLKSLLMLANQKKASRTSTSSPSLDQASLSGHLDPPTWLVHLLNNDQDKLEGSRDGLSPDQHFTMQCFLDKQRLEKQINEERRQRAIHERQQEQLHHQLDELKVKHRQQLKEACDKWEAELDAAAKRTAAQEDRFQEQMEELQERQQRTRERTVALMADKDEEIARLRAAVPADVADLTFHDGEDASQYLALHNPSLHLATLEKDWLSERENLKATTRRLEVSIIELEDTLQETQAELAETKAELDRLNRNRRREGANLEYLKNVVLQYLENSVGRDQKLRAIATILQFTPAETQRAVQANSKSWPFG